MTIYTLSQYGKLTQVLCYKTLLLHSTDLFYWDRSPWRGDWEIKDLSSCLVCAQSQTFVCLWLPHLYKLPQDFGPEAFWAASAVLPAAQSVSYLFFAVFSLCFSILEYICFCCRMSSVNSTCATNLPVSMSGWGWLPEGNCASTAFFRLHSVSSILSSFKVFPEYFNFLSESNCSHSSLQSSEYVFDWLILLCIRHFFKWNSFIQVFCEILPFLQWAVSHALLCFSFFFLADWHPVVGRKLSVLLPYVVFTKWKIQINKTKHSKLNKQANNTKNKGKDSVHHVEVAGLTSRPTSLSLTIIWMRRNKCSLAFLTVT